MHNVESKLNVWSLVFSYTSSMKHNYENDYPFVIQKWKISFFGLSTDFEWF